MVFPVVMYGCESWTKKNTEFQRIYAFELWHWRRLLRVPWTARRSNQLNPEYSLKGLMLKLKLPYFGHLLGRTDSLEKTQMLGNSPLGCKEIQPVHPKGDQSWVYIGGTAIEAETPILWPPDAES